MRGAHQAAHAAVHFVRHRARRILDRSGHRDVGKRAARLGFRRHRAGVSIVFARVLNGGVHG